MTSSITSRQRFSRTNPCPICGGFETMARGAGRRCSGFMSSDATYCHCSREEYAGGLPIESSDTYAHKMQGPCKCGITHNPTTDINNYMPIPIRPAEPKPKNSTNNQNKTQEKQEKNNINLTNPSATWDYLTSDGKLSYQVCRWDLPGGNKTIKQRRPDGRGGWLWDRGDTKPLLYKLPDLLALAKDIAIVICEGEKAADACLKAGLFATTNSGGAGKWSADFNELFRGRKAIILADNDEPGRKHAQAVFDQLKPLAAVKIVELPGLPPKGDAYDWFNSMGKSVQELAEVCRAVEWTKPPKHRYHESELDELPAVEWLLKPFIQDRAINMLSGESGTGKSYLAVNWAKELAQTETVLYLAAEDPSQYPERLKAWNIYHGTEASESKFYLETLPVHLISREFTEEMIKLNEDIRPRLVVIDTWAAATAGSDEINNGEIETILSNARLFVEVWGCAVLIVHHFNKVGTAERGGSALKAGIVQAMKAFMDQDSVRIEFDKTRNGQKPLNVYYRWEKIKVKVRLSDGSTEERDQQVPIEGNYAVIDRDNLTASQESILKWMGTETRRNNEHRPLEVEEGVRVSKRSVTDGLDKLKTLGYLQQSKDRGPYKITEMGLIKVGYKDNMLELVMQ